MAKKIPAEIIIKAKSIFNNYNHTNALCIDNKGKWWFVYKISPSNKLCANLLGYDVPKDFFKQNFQVRRCYYG